MSAYTRIRPEGDLQRFVWRALRICGWMTAGSLVSISGGYGGSPAAQVRRTRSAAPASSAEGEQAERRTGGWCVTLVRRHPTHRRRSGVLYDHNTGQELPCVRNSRKPLDDTNAVTGHKIDNPRP